MRPPSLVPLLFLALLPACTCGIDRVENAQGDLKAAPESLELPRAFIGYPTRATATARNDGRAPLHVVASVEAPFSVTPAEFDLEAGGTQELAILFAPQVEGLAAGKLQLRAEDLTASVALAALGERVPSCDVPSVCETVTFDPVSGTCVKGLAPEGSSCSSADACLSGPHCEKGRCVGTSLSCDDHDLCTRDLCDPAQGCAHLDAGHDCPAPIDPCRVPTCDQKTGCGDAPALDGTPCGPADCSTANVCLAGKCTAVSVPEGAPCELETPCQKQGTCHSGKCDRPPSTPLTPAWTVRIPAGKSAYFPGVADDAGQIYWAEATSLSGQPSPCCFPDARMSFEVVSTTRDGLTRFRKPVSGEFCGSSYRLDAPQLALLGDLLIVGLNNDLVEGHRTADGSTAWTTDLRPLLSAQLVAQRTDWVGTPCSQLEVATLAEGARGALLLDVFGQARDASQHETQASWLVTLDAKTGAVLGKRAWGDPATPRGVQGSLLVDETGNVYLSYGYFGTAALTATGKERWTSKYPNGWYPGSVGRGRMFLLDNTGVDALTGKVQYQLPPSPANLGLYAARPTGNPVLVGRSGAFAIHESVLAGGLGPKFFVDHFDPASGTVAWSTPLLTGPAGASSYSREPDLQPVLTENDSVIVDFHESGAHYLAEVDAQGRQLYACEMRDTAAWTFGIPSLRKGRYAVPGIDRDANGAYVNVVRAYDFGTREPSSQGWATFGGDMMKRHRMR